MLEGPSLPRFHIPWLVWGTQPYLEGRTRPGAALKSLVHLMTKTGCGISPVAFRSRSEPTIYFFCQPSQCPLEIFMHAVQRGHSLESWAKGMDNSFSWDKALKSTRVQMVSGKESLLKRLISDSVFFFYPQHRSLGMLDGMFFTLPALLEDKIICYQAKVEDYENIFKFFRVFEERWHIYLTDTGRRLWRYHTAWSVSEVGTRPSPGRCSGPQQPPRLCYKHSLTWAVWIIPTRKKMSASCFPMFGIKSVKNE